MHLTMMHMWIIIATLVCVIGIGIYSSRSVRSAAGYSVAGQREHRLSQEVSQGR